MWRRRPCLNHFVNIAAPKSHVAHDERFPVAENYERAPIAHPLDPHRSDRENDYEARSLVGTEDDLAGFARDLDCP